MKPPGIARNVVLYGVSRDSIVEAVHRQMDESGLNALSIRAVLDELNLIEIDDPNEPFVGTGMIIIGSKNGTDSESIEKRMDGIIPYIVINGETRFDERLRRYDLPDLDSLAIFLTGYTNRVLVREQSSFFSR